MDLDVYLGRIGYGGPRRASLEALAALQAAHVAAIPFENIDVRLGRPISLDLSALEAKLVRDRRGGYCFEQNGLFAAVLETLGFPVATLEARVRPPGATTILPRTNMVLRVALDGRDVLVDVGFGADGPTGPVPFDGLETRTTAGTYRVAREGVLMVLQRRHRDSWLDLYAFRPEPALPIDFEVANYYTSTHPRSRFVTTLTVQISKPEARHVLRGRSYTITRGEESETRELDAEE
ncbi:MAG: arylamine N-acetyltransferase family protein, partial [Acidithiobacillales bacterium]